MTCPAKNSVDDGGAWSRHEGQQQMNPTLYALLQSAKASPTGLVKVEQRHQGSATVGARDGLLIYRGNLEYELTAEGLAAISGDLK